MQHLPEMEKIQQPEQTWAVGVKDIPSSEFRVDWETSQGGDQELGNGIIFAGEEKYNILVNVFS